jgi:hypothetical protein
MTGPSQGRAAAREAVIVSAVVRIGVSSLIGVPSLSSRAKTSGLYGIAA